MDPSTVTAGAAGAVLAGGKRSAWLSHVKKTMKAHKGKSLKAVLKLASKTFSKTRKTRRGGALSPASVGGRRRKH